MKKTNNIVFIADDVAIPGLGMLKERFRVKDLRGLTTRELYKRILQSSKYRAGSDAVIVRSTRKFDSRILDLLGKNTLVKVICTVSSGFDNIDIVAARKAGIDVVNVPGGNNISAAEFTIAVILAAAKGIIRADSAMKKGRFDSSNFVNFELKDKTIGIIGVGRVGSYTAKLARAFGMKLLGNDIRKDLARRYRFIKFVGLKKLLSESDIVTIHTPLDRTTRNLINAANIPLIKTSSILVNCSRGGTVDEKALIKRLKAGKLKYAAVDVFSNEPDFNREFCRLPNVFLTPHLAGKTLESKDRMSVIAAENIIKYFTKGRTSVKLVN